MRKGKGVPVITKALVKLDGPLFKVQNLILINSTSYINNSGRNGV